VNHFCERVDTSGYYEMQTLTPTQELQWPQVLLLIGVGAKYPTNSARTVIYTTFGFPAILPYWRDSAGDTLTVIWGWFVAGDRMKNANAQRCRQTHASIARAQLENECFAAVRQYLEITEAGCTLLAEVEELPIQENKRNEIFSHRRQELEAHTAYTKARRELWDFLIDPTPDRNDKESSK
jgi:hypothetical protein